MSALNVPGIDLDGHVRTPKTGEMLADRLRRQIVRGELLIGEHLPPEDELTEQFGVARTTLREALRILESQGLIEIKRGRGGGPIVTMPPLDPMARGLAVLLQLQGTTIGDLDDARVAIEPYLAAKLARSHTAEDLQALRDAIEAASQAAEANDQVAFGAAAAVVHETIVVRAANTTLVTFAQMIRTLVTQYYVQGAHRATHDMMRRAARSYRKFYELIEAGDEVAVEAHWRIQMRFTRSGQDPDAPLRLFEV